MMELIPNRARKIIVPGAFFFLAMMAVCLHSMEVAVSLTPPALRPVKDPFLVIPTDFTYPNLVISLPAYRESCGISAAGWSSKFIDTRRFASDRSAWIYYRPSDLQNSVWAVNEASGQELRFWPVGSTLVIEIYKGTAFQNNKNDKLIEIAVMSKTETGKNSSNTAFYPANWSYASFTPDGVASTTPAKIRECHQCHSIAFYLTGDLVFTQFSNQKIDNSYIKPRNAGSNE